jgi:hypothetical protein
MPPSHLPTRSSPASGDDIAARAEAISRAITQMVLADEALFRNQLRISHELWFSRDGDLSVPVREGRRLAWIDAALAPAAGRASEHVTTRLRSALAAVVGVEPVISLRDVCGLSPQDTEDCLAWTARSLVRAASADLAAGSGRHQADS